MTIYYNVAGKVYRINKPLGKITDTLEEIDAYVRTYFNAGKKINLHYNPKNPQKAFVNIEFNDLFFIFPIIIILPYLISVSLLAIPNYDQVFYFFNQVIGLIVGYFLFLDLYMCFFRKPFRAKKQRKLLETDQNKPILPQRYPIKAVQSQTELGKADSDIDFKELWEIKKEEEEKGL